MTERPASFDAEVVARRAQVKAFAVKLTGSVERAEDLVQDTMLRAFDACDQYRPGTNLTGWLMTICRNSFLSQIRKRKREVEDPDDTAAKLTPVPAEQDGKVELREVRRRIRLLPKDQRDALVLIMNGHSIEETAAALGVADGTIKSRVHRARAFLEGQQ